MSTDESPPPDAADASTADAPTRDERRPSTVDIFGRRYKIASEHDPETLRALARHVDRRMRQISRQAEPGDVVGAAVMAALNIADDYYRTRRALERRDREITERARGLADRLEQAVETTTEDEIVHSTDDNPIEE